MSAPDSDEPACCLVTVFTPGGKPPYGAYIVATTDEREAWKTVGKALSGGEIVLASCLRNKATMAGYDIAPGACVRIPVCKPR